MLLVVLKILLCWLIIGFITAFTGLVIDTFIRKIPLGDHNWDLLAIAVAAGPLTLYTYIKYYKWLI